MKLVGVDGAVVCMTFPGVEMGTDVVGLGLLQGKADELNSSDELTLADAVVDSAMLVTFASAKCDNSTGKFQLYID